MSLTTDRLISASALFVLTLIVGTLPVYLIRIWMRWRQKKTVIITSSENASFLSTNFYIQILTQIGGGILFFTVFVHVIPEIREDFDDYLKRNDSIFSDGTTDDMGIKDLSIPYLELAISCGFFAVYLAEVLMHSLIDSHHSSEETIKEEVYDFEKPSVRDSDISTIESESTGARTPNEDEPVLIAIRCHKTKCDIATHPHNIVKEEPILVRALHGLVIISAFSIHSVFDGISIGVKTTTNEIWTMFIAIASHKLMIALIIGVELYEKCSSYLLVVIHMILFSIMSPIGIILVIVSESSSHGDSETNPVTILLSAIASGTILYIVFFEILQKDRVSKLKPLTQFVSMAIGFGLMFCVTITLKEQ